MEFDCIIVLANEMDKEGNLNDETISRINLAYKLFLCNKSSYLITCGWDYRIDSSLFIGNVMKEFALKLGVPDKKIISEINSRDTVGDAFFTKHNIIKKRGWKNLLVVTSNYHVDRTLKIFKFIYGVDYNFKVFGAKGFDSYKKLITEKKSIKSFKETFKNINEGDDINIFKNLIHKHPYYNGLNYPKIEFSFNEL